MDTSRTTAGERIEASEMMNRSPEEYLMPLPAPVRRNDDGACAAGEERAGQQRYW
jgi:hypothetical protein